MYERYLAKVKDMYWVFLDLEEVYERVKRKAM